MSPASVKNAVAKREETPRTPAQMIDQYPAEFTDMLPSHISGASWLKTAKAALKKGKIIDEGPNKGRFEIELAAANNPSAFFQALREAATLGLRPGTKEYYLTPRKQKGRLEILGIVGYQGIVELMYRAGAVSSVIVEAVFTGDQFRFSPGRDEIPVHEIDWDAEDRGELRLAYAYARMKDGGYSKVVVLNRKHIKRIMESSAGSDSKYSPWQTDTEAMWLKSAARQLEKWVPTSAEYREAMIRDAVAIQTARHASPLTRIDPAPLDVDPDTGQIVDAVLVDDPEPQPEPEPRPQQQQRRPSAYSARGNRPAGADQPIGKSQLSKLHASFSDVGIADRAEKLEFCSSTVGRPVESTEQLTGGEASKVIDALAAAAAQSAQAQQAAAEQPVQEPDDDGWNDGQ